MSMPYTKLQDEFTRLIASKSATARRPMEDYLNSFKIQKSTFVSRIDHLPPDLQEKLKKKLSDKGLTDSVNSNLIDIPVLVMGALMDIHTAFKLLTEKKQ